MDGGGFFQAIGLSDTEQPDSIERKTVVVNSFVYGGIPVSKLIKSVTFRECFENIMRLRVFLMAVYLIKNNYEDWKEFLRHPGDRKNFFYLFRRNDGYLALLLWLAEDIKYFFLPPNRQLLRVQDCETILPKEGKIPLLGPQVKGDYLEFLQKWHDFNRPYIITMDINKLINDYDAMIYNKTLEIDKRANKRMDEKEKIIKLPELNKILSRGLNHYGFPVGVTICDSYFNVFKFFNMVSAILAMKLPVPEQYNENENFNRDILDVVGNLFPFFDIISVHFYLKKSISVDLQKLECSLMDCVRIDLKGLVDHKQWNSKPDENIYHPKILKLLEEKHEYFERLSFTEKKDMKWVKAIDKFDQPEEYFINPKYLLESIDYLKEAWMGYTEVEILKRCVRQKSDHNCRS